MEEILGQDLNVKQFRRLLNAIWMAHKRGQQVTKLGVYEYHLESPLHSNKKASLFESACDYAISNVLPMVVKGHGPHPGMFKQFEWVSDVPGSVDAQPGTRRMGIKVYSIRLISSDQAQELNNLYKRLRS